MAAAYLKNSCKRNLKKLACAAYSTNAAKMDWPIITRSFFIEVQVV